MSRSLRLAALLLLSAPVLADNSPFVLTLSQPDYAPTETISLNLAGQPGQYACVLFDPDCTPTEILPGLIVDIGLSAHYFELGLVLPPTGSLTLNYDFDCGFAALIQSLGGHFCAQAISLDPVSLQLCVSNLADVDFTNTYGFCAPCSDCVGGVDGLTLRYLGPSSAFVEVVATGKHAATHFSGTVQPGEAFSFLPAGGKDSFGEEVELQVDGQTQATVHTSCSAPIGPGMVFGDFRVLAANSRDGGAICPASNPGPATDCSAGKPIKLEMKYTGGDCSASDNDQSSDKATCTGDPAGHTKVHVIATGKSNVYFAGTLNLGETFWFDPLALGLGKIDNNLVIDVFDESNNWLQTVTFHASCSQPLAVGDVFGSFELVTFVPKP